MGRAIIVSLIAATVRLFKFPKLVSDSCTAITNFDPKQWFLCMFPHESNMDFAYQIISSLWRGAPLEGSSGSRRFAFMALKTLLMTEAMIVMAVQGLQLWDAAYIYLSSCQGFSWGILFGMSGFLLPASQNWNLLVLAAILTAKLIFVYLFYSVILLSAPACVTLADLLCTYAPQLIISFWDAAENRVESSFQTIEVQENLVWKCQSCTSVNGVFLTVCDSCGASRGVVATDSSVMDNSQSSSVSRRFNPELIGLAKMQNTDRTGLVWKCMSCTSENGVFLNVCDNCGTLHETIATDNSVMDDPQSFPVSRMPNPEYEIQSFDKTGLVWSCMSCTFENGVFLHVCERCEAPHGAADCDNSVMDEPQNSYISRMLNLELIGLTEMQNTDRTVLVWNCMSCTFENGVFFHGCEMCGTPHHLSVENRI